MKMVVHFIFEDRKDLVASAMTGEELGIRKFGFQPLSQSCQFVFRLQTVK